MMSFFTKILLLFLATVLVAGIEDEDPHRPTREKCSKQLDIDEEHLKLGNNNPESFKCYIFCFLKDLNVMDSFGNFYPETAVNAINEDLRNASRPGVFQCYERIKGGNELCEYAYDIVKCFADDSPEIYSQFGIFSVPKLKKHGQQEQQERQHQK